MPPDQSIIIEEMINIDIDIIINVTRWRENKLRLTSDGGRYCQWRIELLILMGNDIDGVMNK